jgi:hypothetical protein
MALQKREKDANKVIGMSEDEEEYFEERAAVLEFQFGYSREAAEKEARRRLAQYRACKARTEKKSWSQEANNGNQ